MKPKNGKLIYARPAKLTAKEKRNYAKARRLLDLWVKDESGEQERSWAIASKLLKAEGHIRGGSPNGKRIRA